MVGQKRNTKKEKRKRNKAFPYKSRIKFGKSDEEILESLDDLIESKDKEKDKKMKKEVQTQLKEEVKKIILLDIINAINQGKNIAHISKDFKVSKQRLQYYIRKLKNKGMIKKIGYGVWETTERSKTLTKDTREVRGHAFMWKVKLPKIKNWNKRIQVLEKMKIPYKLLGTHNKTPRILVKDRKIWLGSNYLIIFEPKSFLAHTATEAKNYAVLGLKQLLEDIEARLKVSFKIRGNYQFKVRRNHYALIKNLIAKQFNKEGKPMNIFYEGDLWFIIDNSYNLEEAETVHIDTAIPDNKGFQGYMNSHKRTDFKVTPDFILKTLNQVTQNQMMMDKNVVKHFEVLKGIEEAIKILSKKVGKLK